jgi:hypothetical protein
LEIGVNETGTTGVTAQNTYRGRNKEQSLTEDLEFWILHSILEIIAALLGQA